MPGLASLNNRHLLKRVKGCVMIVKDIYVQDSDPTPDDGQRGGVLWINSITGGWFYKTELGYVKIEHSHLTHGDIEFTGNTVISGHLYAEDKKGENAEVVIPGVGTLKFKHGIMHDFNPV